MLEYHHIFVQVHPSDEIFPRPLPGPQTSCCTQVIAGSEVMCGTEMEAPCIIDPGASCGALATLPPSLGLQLSWLPLVRVG